MLRIRVYINYVYLFKQRKYYFIKILKNWQLLKKQLSWKFGRSGNCSNLRSECESKLFENVVSIPEAERQMIVVKRMGQFQDGNKSSFVALGMISLNGKKCVSAE